MGETYVRFTSGARFCGYYERAELGVFRCPATFAGRSPGRSFEFSSRRREACRPSCILPFLDSTCEERTPGRRRCVGTRTHTHTLFRVFVLCTAALVPVALDKGIGDARGCCSLWLVWVRLTIWIHGTVITTLRHLSHSLSLSAKAFSHSPSPLPPQAWHSLCLSHSHRAFSPPCHAPHRPGNTSRLLPSSDILSIRFHRRLVGPSRQYREDSHHRDSCFWLDPLQSSMVTDTFPAVFRHQISNASVVARRFLVSLVEPVDHLF